MLFVMLWACTGAGGESAAPVDCASLSVDDCSGESSCVVSEAWPIVEGTDGSCYDTSSKVGVVCMDADVACADTGAARALETDPDTCYYFGSSCGEQGLTLCDVDVSPC